jgi:hypothetical protein
MWLNFLLGRYPSGLDVLAQGMDLVRTAAFEEAFLPEFLHGFPGLLLIDPIFTGLASISSITTP